MSRLLFNGKNNDMFHINIDNVSFFLKETFLLYLTLTNFTQRKRKMYDANDY